jgi:hypothetical protein
MLRKVQVQMNPDIPAATRQTWSVAWARTHDGREVSARCRHYRGSIDNPMPREEHLSKVRTCARRVLRSQDIERIITMVQTLEDRPDLGQMLAILRQRPAA